MKDLDKIAMGKRIRQIRLGAGLRQWELARMLGTTQSAVHKYEHGVVPEPRRLIELARVGSTSIEWVLTGRHWDSGSETQERLSPEVLRTASSLREISEQHRATVDEALGIMREAVRVLEDGDPSEGGEAPSVDSLSREQCRETLELLESAWKVQRSVLKRLAKDATRRLDAKPAVPSSDTPGDGEEPGSKAAAR